MWRSTSTKDLSSFLPRISTNWGRTDKGVVDGVTVGNVNLICEKGVGWSGKHITTWNFTNIEEHMHHGWNKKLEAHDSGGVTKSWLRRRTPGTTGTIAPHHLAVVTHPCRRDTGIEERASIVLRTQRQWDGVTALPVSHGMHIPWHTVLQVV